VSVKNQVWKKIIISVMVMVMDTRNISTIIIILRIYLNLLPIKTNEWR
jgi:hypothetical protein